MPLRAWGWLAQMELSSAVERVAGAEALSAATADADLSAESGT